MSSQTIKNSFLNFLFYWVYYIQNLIIADLYLHYRNNKMTPGHFQIDVLSYYKKDDPNYITKDKCCGRDVVEMTDSLKCSYGMYKCCMCDLSDMTGATDYCDMNCSIRDRAIRECSTNERDVEFNTQKLIDIKQQHGIKHININS